MENTLVVRPFGSPSACENHSGVFMAAFGSFALLIALALAAWNLLAGAVALRLIATGQPSAISPERLADTARRAGIAGFWAVTAAALAVVYAAVTRSDGARG